MSQEGSRAVGKTSIQLAFIVMALFSARPALAGGGLTTERVVLVTVDGLRNSEAFLLQPPSGFPHPYLPRLWQLFRENGTVFTGTMLLEKASTTRGLNTIYSGTWNGGPNRGTRICECDENYQDNRSLTPLIGEHVVKDLGLAPSEVAFYNGKPNGLLGDHSFHPAYGPTYCPGTIVFINSKSEDYPFRVDEDGDLLYEFVDETNGDDVLAGRIADDLVFSPGRSDYPRLVIVHLGVIDLAGHTGQFSLYADALRNADEEIHGLYTFFENHPAYSGKTTYVLTTDHGRHDQAHGGIQQHGGTCFGCRNLALGFVGPDTPAGQLVTRPTLAVDIAPTVAAFLGVSMPHAEGRVLPEAGPLLDPVVEWIGGTRAVFDDENVVVAATRRIGSGPLEIITSRAEPSVDPLVFEAPQALSTPGAFVADRPALALGTRGIIGAWREMPAFGGIWAIFAAESLDGAATFSPPRLVVVGRREVDSSLGMRKLEGPAVAPSPRGDVVFVPVESQRNDEHVVMFTSRDGFDADVRAGVVIKDAFVDHAPSSQFDQVDAYAAPDGSTVVAWIDASRSENDDPDRRYSWEIYLRRLEGAQRGPIVRVTDDAEPSLFPRLVADTPRDRIHVVYVTRIGGIFQVALRTSSDGRNFGPVIQISSSGVGAWKPAPLLLGTGELLVAYEDHAVGGGDILVALYSPGTGEVSPPMNLTSTALLSRQPSVFRIRGQATGILVWEELTAGGMFELRGSRFSLQPLRSR